MNVQASLFSSPPAQKPHGPVFGVPARWICFADGLCADAAENYHRRRNGLAPLYSCCTPDHADISFLYLLTHVGEEKEFRVRLECPALGLRLDGDFAEIWPRFVRLTADGAERLTGRDYSTNRDAHGCSPDCVITVAWRGETTAIKGRSVPDISPVRPMAAAAQKKSSVHNGENLVL